MPENNLETASDDHATLLALDIGGDDMGAAWLIARRSPTLSRSQVANAATNEGMRDTTGRRRLARNEDGSKESADEYLERTSRRELGRRTAITTTAELPPDLRSLAADCAEQLGELGAALTNGFTLIESAELADISYATAKRRIDALRHDKARRISDQLCWRDFV